VALRAALSLNGAGEGDGLDWRQRREWPCAPYSRKIGGLRARFKVLIRAFWPKCGQNLSIKVLIHAFWPEFGQNLSIKVLIHAFWPEFGQNTRIKRAATRRRARARPGAPATRTWE
jgi:hypothetical protein